MKQPIEIENGIKLYCKSMGKVFRVYEICESDDEANAYMEKHDDAAVIACDTRGRVYLACKYSNVCRSSELIDD